MFIVYGNIEKLSLSIMNRASAFLSIERLFIYSKIKSFPPTVTYRYTFILFLLSKTNEKAGGPVPQKCTKTG